MAVLKQIWLLKSLGVCYWCGKIPQCGYMEHGLKDIAFYVQKHITLHSCHNFPAGLWQAARYTRILKWVYYGNISLGQHWLMTGCCLMTPSHYLNQCWLTSGEVHWHLSQGNLQENYQSKIPFKSPRGQWVNIFWPDAVSLVPPWGYKRNGEICCFHDTYMWHKAKMI